MTPREKQTLDYIGGFICENGYSPSFDEIRIAAGLKSKSGVHRILQQLKEKKLIRLTRFRARTVRIVMHKCPHCGGEL